MAGRGCKQSCHTCPRDWHSGQAKAVKCLLSRETQPTSGYTGRSGLRPRWPGVCPGCFRQIG